MKNNQHLELLEHFLEGYEIPVLYEVKDELNTIKSIDDVRERKEFHEANLFILNIMIDNIKSEDELSEDEMSDYVRTRWNLKESIATEKQAIVLCDKRIKELLLDMPLDERIARAAGDAADKIMNLPEDEFNEVMTILNKIK